MDTILEKDFIALEMKKKGCLEVEAIMAINQATRSGDIEEF